MEKQVPYQAYLLRLWPTKRNELAGYRVSLQSVATGEQRDFADLKSLFVFLQAQREASPTTPKELSGLRQHE
jgi:hypothetical protein